MPVARPCLGAFDAKPIWDKKLSELFTLATINKTNANFQHPSLRIAQLQTREFWPAKDLLYLRTHSFLTLCSVSPF